MEGTEGESSNRNRRIYLLSVFHFVEFSAGENNCKYKRGSIGNRTCIHDTVNSHKHRKDDNQRKQEENLSCQRHDDTKTCFSYRSKKSGGHRLDAGGEGQKHKNPQVVFGKFKVKITSFSKHPDNLVWEKLEAKEKITAMMVQAVAE